MVLKILRTIFPELVYSINIFLIGPNSYFLLWKSRKLPFVSKIPKTLSLSNFVGLTDITKPYDEQG